MVALGLGTDSRRNPPLQLRSQTRVVEPNVDQVMNKFAAKFRIPVEISEVDKP